MYVGGLIKQYMSPLVDLGMHKLLARELTLNIPTSRGALVEFHNFFKKKKAVLDVYSYEISQQTYHINGHVDRLLHFLISTTL